MQIAFLGGTRFIGHHAAALAVERGHRVWVLHRGQHPCEVPGASDVLVDRHDPSALCDELRKLAPDALVDTRPMTRSQAEVTALAVKIFHIPTVALSSVDVYAQFGRLNGLQAPPPEPLVTESSPLTTPYPFREIGGHDDGPDYDKKEVEAVLSAASAEVGVSVTALRLPGVYGWRDHRRRFGGLVDALDAGERVLPCQGGAAWRLTHVHARDVAHAVVLAAERPPAGYRVFNVGERATPTMRERAEQLAAALGVAVSWQEVDAVPPALGLLGRAPNDLVIDSSLIRETLGFDEITTPAERVADVIAWARHTRAPAWR